VNIKFPFSLDSRGQTETANNEDHIRQMLEQLILTNPGERVNRPDFGSGALQLVFSPNSPELAATVQFTLQAAIQQWLSDLIDVQELNVSAVDSLLTIYLSYMIIATKQPQTATFTRAV
jgi:phage baseplate assembly protein W